MELSILPPLRPPHQQITDCNQYGYMDRVRKNMLSIDPMIIPSITMDLLGTVFVDNKTNLFVYISSNNRGKGLIILIGYNYNEYVIPDPKDDDFNFWYKPLETEYFYLEFTSLNEPYHFFRNNISLKTAHSIWNIIKSSLDNIKGIPYYF